MSYFFKPTVRSQAGQLVNNIDTGLPQLPVAKPQTPTVVMSHPEPVTVMNGNERNGTPGALVPVYIRTG